MENNGGAFRRYKFWARRMVATGGTKIIQTYHSTQTGGLGFLSSQTRITKTLLRFTLRRHSGYQSRAMAEETNSHPCSHQGQVCRISKRKN
jgi:hypothetical protein